MNINRLSKKVREQMVVFQEIALDGITKPKKKFVDQMLYGIISSKTVLISKISRSLKEPIKLIKTENRLCRNLGDGKIGKLIQNGIIKNQRDHIKKDTLLALDFSDISKGYAKKMEYITYVRDGSKNETAMGYNTCQVVGVEKKNLIPLYGKLYSTIEPEFRSENKEMFNAIDSVSNYCGNNGVWLIDRGADRNKVFEYMVKNGKDFIIRIKGNRILLTGNYFSEKNNGYELANNCRIEEEEEIFFKKNEKQELYKLQYGRRAVTIAGIGSILYLTVIWGFTKDKPMMLLSSKDRSAKKIFRSYLSRWRIEDMIRFTKQVFDLENIRVLKYQSLQNIYSIITLATVFMITYLSKEEGKFFLEKF